MVKTLISTVLVALALAASATSANPNSPAQQTQGVACSARASPGDVDVGIDILTDASCVDGGLGCLGTVCRFCKVKETPASAYLQTCASIQGSTGPACENLLSPGDKSVGISVARDAQCSASPATPVGCISETSCRYCQETETPQSKHLALCSAIISPALALSAATSMGEATASGGQGAGATQWETPVIGVAAVAAVAVAAFAAKRARDSAPADDAMVTPTNMMHRNEPLCTL